MKRFIVYAGMLLLQLVAASAYGDSPDPKPPPELRKLNVWIGNWVLSGTAKDHPDEREHPIRWRLHEHWVLNNFFLQVDQTWSESSRTLHALEMLSYDPTKRVYTDFGFGSDGSTWSLTASFHGTTMIERGQTEDPDGAMTRCQMTWTFSNDSTSVSGTQRCEKNGTRWQALKVRGAKSK